MSVTEHHPDPAPLRAPDPTPAPVTSASPAVTVVPVTSETRVSVTMGQFLGAVVTLAVFTSGMVYTVISLTVGSLKEDVALIRTAAQESSKSLQAVDKEGLIRLRDSETRLADQITGLRTDVGSFRGELAIVGGKIEAAVIGTNAKLDVLTQKIDLLFSRLIPSREGNSGVLPYAAASPVTPVDTESAARALLEAKGYKGVTGLTRDSSGNWSGKVRTDNREVSVGITRYGSVVPGKASGTR